MEPLKVDCVLNYSYEHERLFMLYKTNKQGVVVSAEFTEVVNNADTVIRSLVMAALQETEQFHPFMMIESNIEVVDPITMRFMLDSRIEIDVLTYRRCEDCHKILVEFIDMAMA